MALPMPDSDYYNSEKGERRQSSIWLAFRGSRGSGACCEAQRHGGPGGVQIATAPLALAAATQPLH